MFDQIDNAKGYALLGITYFKLHIFSRFINNFLDARASNPWLSPLP